MNDARQTFATCWTLVRGSRYKVVLGLPSITLENSVKYTECNRNIRQVLCRMLFRRLFIFILNSKYNLQLSQSTKMTMQTATVNPPDESFWTGLENIKTSAELTALINSVSDTEARTFLTNHLSIENEKLKYKNPSTNTWAAYENKDQVNQISPWKFKIQPAQATDTTGTGTGTGTATTGNTTQDAWYWVRTIITWIVIAFLIVLVVSTLIGFIMSIVGRRGVAVPVARTTSTTYRSVPQTATTSCRAV